MGAAQSVPGCCVHHGSGERRRMIKAVQEEGSLPDVAARLQADPAWLYWSTFGGGNTLWHKAAKAGRLDVLKAMAATVESVCEPPKAAADCAMHAHGHAAAAAAARRAILLKSGPTTRDALRRLVNSYNFKRCTPLMLAAGGGHADVVRFLLDQGAVLLVHDRMRHQTALHYAVESGSAECVQLLLGAASHTAPAQPPLLPQPPSPQQLPGGPAAERLPAAAAGARATQQQQQQRADRLTERQQLLAAGNHAGLTALHYAVHQDSFDALRLLLAHGADVTAQADYPDLDWPLVNAGDTPLHIAAARGGIESIRLLLKGYVESSGQLCPEHAPPHRARDPRGIRNDHGRLPYHLAMRRSFTWLAELLDPSIPVRYLLTGEEPGTATSFGPPRLAAIAAKALHDKLIAELTEIKAAAGDAGDAGGGGVPNSLQVAAAAAEAAAAAAAAARARRRRWSLSKGRVSNSDGSIDDSGEDSRGGAAQAAGGPLDGGTQQPASHAPSRRGSSDGATRATSPLLSGAFVSVTLAGAGGRKRGNTASTDAGQVLCELEPMGSGAACEGGEGAGVGGVDVAAAAADDPKVSLKVEVLDDAAGLLRPPQARDDGPATSPSSRCASRLSSEDAVTCGICLDAPPATCIRPCMHVICADCALDMCKRYSLGTAACPFCRALVSGFRAATRDEMRQQ